MTCYSSLLTSSTPRTATKSAAETGGRSSLPITTPNPNPTPSPYPNLILTRWALIASYRDATVDDACRVFPRPRAVLRRKCKALGQQTADANRTSPEELAARYIMPAKMHALNAALPQAP